jgi:hypothetical protein
MYKPQDHRPVPQATPADGRDAEKGTNARRAVTRCPNLPTKQHKGRDEPERSDTNSSVPLNSLRRKASASDFLQTATLGLNAQPALPGRVSSPQRDNMGGDNATGASPTGYRFNNVRIVGKPSDYFHRLALDTLQVSVRGEWTSYDCSERCVRFRQDAERQDAPLPIEVEFDGVRLEAYPHGARPGYQVLLRGPDGLEIRACPSIPNMPSLLFRLGARFCVERGASGLDTWVRGFLRELGFDPSQISLSEAHIRCDVPEPFLHEHLAGIKGLATRNAGYSTHVDGRGRLSGINNLGGKRSLTFSIYDKRLEQRKKRGCFWPGYWKGFQIPDDSPIWRVESRFKREKLLARGFDALEDLTDTAMKNLWHHFASEYLVFVAAPAKRLSRAGHCALWRPIAGCGEAHTPVAVTFDIDFSEAQMMKQAEGVLAAVYRETAASEACSAIESTARDAVAHGSKKALKQLLEPGYLDRVFERVLDKNPTLDEAARERGAKGLADVLRQKLASRASKRAFSENPGKEA